MGMSAYSVAKTPRKIDPLSIPWQGGRH